MPREFLAPGFFGKLPLSGDFVARRLPGEFVAVWDRFASGFLVPMLQRAWPENGLRFLLGPGQAGPQAMAGLVLPSRDRVGREFPLTIAAPIVTDVTPRPLAQWFAEMTGPAQDAAEGLIDAGELDLALEACALPEMKQAPEAMILTLPGGAPVTCSLDDPAAALAALFGGVDADL
jgi:type VI secretion system protein ImpM